MTTQPHAHDDDRPLLPVEDVRDGILARIRPLPAVELPLEKASGRALAADVVAPFHLPPFTSSAMDGYAVRAVDIAEASPDHPVSLRRVGEVEMGHPADVGVGAGEAVAVPTGGAVPRGADAVVPVEQTQAAGDRVLVLASLPAGRHVRPAGQDVSAGELLVPAGRQLLGPDLGLLASAGLDAVAVHPPARVGLLSTGDELVPPGRPLGEGQVYDANRFTLAGAVREAGGRPVDLGAVRDDPEALVEALDRASDRFDVAVSSGGVAMGERDPVKRAFEKGGEIDFYEVAMQPGKPQAFGFRRGRPFFGLPGNPVSVFVSFEVFVRPALRTLMGLPAARPEVTAELGGDIEGLPRKTRYARVRLRPGPDGLIATPAGGHQSNLLATLARADGLAIVPAGVGMLREGENCRVLPFRDPGDR